MTTGNSVLLHSGQFAFQLPLLSVNSLGGMGWEFSLDYLSGNNVDDVMGLGFNFPQNMVLEEDVGFVELLSGNNSRERFNEVSPGVYQAAAGNNTEAELSRTGSGTPSDEFTLRSSRGVITKFFGFHASITAPGRLTSITDRFGSSQTFSWAVASGVVQLATLTDSYGRVVAYRYFDASQGHRLREIEDFLGRKLNFQYDGIGHLVAAVTPSINRAAEGNDFPGGTAYVFEYDVDNSEPERRDDLIKIYYPNQTAPYVNSSARTVDVSQVYTNAVPRYLITYGQDPNDADTWGRVTNEQVGNPSGGSGGSYQMVYTTTGLPQNIVDPASPIVLRCTLTDRNGNQKVVDFTANKMAARVEINRNRNKINIPSTIDFPSYITWTKFNQQNQPTLIIFPEGNSVEYEYEDGEVSGISGIYNRRAGLLLRETRKVDNPLKNDPTNPIPARRDGASNGQTQLTRRYFYEPIFNQQTAMIEERGNPIDDVGTYFAPQNGGTTPTDANRTRYTTISYFDYQKDTSAAVTGDASLQSALGLSAAEIQSLITHVDNQMKATGGAGGIPAGFAMSLGDINGDGSGNGASSGLPASKHLGNIVKVKHPEVRLIGSASIAQQVREEIFTTNDRGQMTTHTDAEGNLFVYVRYPDSDPEGDGQFVVPAKGNKQYGRMREIHVDADPNDIMSLVGTEGDLLDFITGKITRTNTPGEYQDLVTRYEGTNIGTGSGCSTCAYDALGNPLAQTDPRGFTTHFERNELGEVYRTISPDPYRYVIETHFDANRNVVRVDTQDQWVQYQSDDPTSANFAHFTPSGSGTTAHVPSRLGFGGSIRPGWFTDLMSYDLLNNLTEEDRDATGSQPERLVTTHQYDANQNRVMTTKPQGNTIEMDYDERDLNIAHRIGNSPATPAVMVHAYDGNGNRLQEIGPAQRGGAGNWQTVTIGDAFGDGSPLVHTGDFVLEHSYDGFNRVTQAKDAVGNVAQSKFDPGSRTVETLSRGPVGGATPTNRSGAANVDLAKSFLRYDEAGRQYEVQSQVFVGSGTTFSSTRNVTHTGGGLESNSTGNGHTGTVTLVSGGVATANSTYTLARTVSDRASRVVETLSDNTGKTMSQYDGANRRIKQTDALGNVSELAYDANGNVTQVTSTEKCTITGPQTIADEVFKTRTRYDSLNRPIVQAVQGADGSLDAAVENCQCGLSWVTDRSTIMSLVGYDSRGNQTLVVDAKGNTTITVYDGASRPTQVQEHLREQGLGQNPPADDSTFLAYGGATIRSVSTSYDGNGRVLRLIDNNGNPTAYDYDTLDRETQMIFPDSSARTYAYNTASDVTQFTDENGSVFANTFDALGRKTLVSEVVPIPRTGEVLKMG